MKAQRQVKQQTVVPTGRLHVMPHTFTRDLKCINNVADSLEVVKKFCPVSYFASGYHRTISFGPKIHALLVVLVRRIVYCTTYENLDKQLILLGKRFRGQR